MIKIIFSLLILIQSALIFAENEQKEWCFNRVGKHDCPKEFQSEAPENKKYTHTRIKVVQSKEHCCYSRED